MRNLFNLDNIIRCFRGKRAEAPDGRGANDVTMGDCGGLNRQDHLNVNRPVFQQDTIDKNYLRKDDEQSNGDGDSPFGCNVKFQPRKTFLRLFPCIGWLSTYKWKEYLLKDIIAGCTVAIMNIPQGMAYALLGNVPPVVGIYMAFFPVLVYTILGTSRHISMGSFAVICLMTGKVVASYSTPPLDAAMAASSILNDTTMVQQAVPSYTPLQVGVTVTFMVALFQLLMFICRLGIVCTLLSDTLINGFTAGAAVQVFTSQVKDLFGVKIPKASGPFAIVQTYTYLFINIQNSNLAATIISGITIVILVINNEVLKPFISKKTIFPIPIELIVVLAGTLLSMYCGLDEIYQLKTVGHIDVGLPSPVVPEMDLLPSIALESLIIAIIAYVVSLSMALIFANKLNYEIDPNQELLAQGCGNLCGSFFSCLPFAASLSRSVIQQSVGGVTQLTSLVSCFILLFVLLWIAPFFEPLPRCILSSLIVVALKGVLFQVFDLPSIWRSSKLDGLVWILTYSSVILIEIDIGLLVGVAASMAALLCRGLKSHIHLLERLPGTDIYVDITRYKKTESVPGIIVVHYAGCINFINRSYFRKGVLKAVHMDPNNARNNNNQIRPAGIMEYVILDFSALHYIDPSGAATLLTVIGQMSAMSKKVILAAMSGSVQKTLKNCLKDPSKPDDLTWFPTVHDAVVFAQSKLQEPLYSIRL